MVCVEVSCTAMLEVLIVQSWNGAAELSGLGLLIALEIFMVSQLLCGGVPGPGVLFVLATRMHVLNFQMLPQLMKAFEVEQAKQSNAKCWRTRCTPWTFATLRKKRKALYAVAGERQAKAHALQPDGCLGFLDPFSLVFAGIRIAGMGQSVQERKGLERHSGTESSRVWYLKPAWHSFSAVYYDYNDCDVTATVSSVQVWDMYIYYLRYIIFTNLGSR